MSAHEMKPNFQPLITPESIGAELNGLAAAVNIETEKHAVILSRLLEVIQPVDFKSIVFPESDNLTVRQAELKAIKEPNETEHAELKEVTAALRKCRVGLKHYLIITIEQIISTAEINRWGICRNLEFVYLYNGAFWLLVDVPELQKFFGEAAEKMGVPKYESRHHIFREQLYKQFIATAYLPKPQPAKETILINLQNGTFEISPDRQRLRTSHSLDFITYQLPFAFQTDAKAPIFEAFLNRVLPDVSRQHILSEYLAYVFIRPATLKLEKTLLLYGTGANGKSVFFEVVNALLGAENVSSYSLQSLTNESGYFRAKLANKLVNYASEINGKLETATFKQLVSGEPVEARLPYGEPFTLTDYAKLIFNCNELPKDVEHTHAYFRRFLIVPFDIQIPEQEQDKELPKKIITTELSGVFNWVLAGLARLLENKKFTDCDAVREQVEQYRRESDSVTMFMDDEGYATSLSEKTSLKELYRGYGIYCNDGGYRAVSIKTFSERLRANGYEIVREAPGNMVFCSKIKECF